MSDVDVASLDLGPTVLNLRVTPGDHIVTATFTDETTGDPTDETGTWLAYARKTPGGPAVDITITVDDSDAAAADGGEIRFEFDGTELAAMIASGGGEWRGIWGATKDGIEEFAGDLVIAQKIGRA